MIQIQITCTDFTEASVLLAKCAEGKRLLLNSAAEVEPAIEGAALQASFHETVATQQDAAPAADSAGLPWDDRIHSSNKALNADGTWRKRRGVADETVAIVEAELRGKSEHQAKNDEAAETKAEQQKEEPKPEPAQVAGEAPDIQTVRDALQKVVDKHGMDAARAFIVEQGFERVTGIPEDKFADFIAACEKKAA